MGRKVTEGEKKQDKKGPKWASMACFVIHVRGEKKQEGDRYDHGDQGGEGEQ